MIATEKANIDSINTAIQAITDKNQLMHQQVEVLKAQNRKAVINAAKQAEDETLSQMENEVIEKVSIIDDPFATYGNVRW